MENSTLLKTQSIMQGIPLEEIKKLLIIVIPMIPGGIIAVPIIIKIVDTLIQSKTVVCGVVSKISDSKEEELRKDKNALRIMIEMALEDGEITPDEKQLILQKANSMKIDVETIEFCLATKNIKALNI